MSNTESMVERVARAIARTSYVADPDRFAENNWPRYTGEAKAAIEAMREPTTAMYRATDGLGDAYGFDHESKRHCVTYETIQGLYQAMIDAALKEGEDES